MNTEFVQKGHKRVRTREVLLFLQRRVLPQLDIHAISRLTLARNNPCTTERSIPKEAEGIGISKM